MKIITNASGSRSIEITELHLATILKYDLFRDLVDSTGFVSEDVLEKLRLNIRALLEQVGTSDRALMDLCFDVIYHPNMKAIGLQNLLETYNASQPAREGEDAD